jgi:hypothetical protein
VQKGVCCGSHHRVTEIVTANMVVLSIENCERRRRGAQMTREKSETVLCLPIVEADGWPVGLGKERRRTRPRLPMLLLPSLNPHLHTVGQPPAYSLRERRGEVAQVAMCTPCGASYKAACSHGKEIWIVNCHCNSICQSKHQLRVEDLLTSETPAYDNIIRIALGSASSHPRPFGLGPMLLLTLAVLGCQ